MEQRVRLSMAVVAVVHSRGFPQLIEAPPPPPPDTVLQLENCESIKAVAQCHGKTRHTFIGD